MKIIRAEVSTFGILALRFYTFNIHTACMQVVSAKTGHLLYKTIKLFCDWNFRGPLGLSLQRDDTYPLRQTGRPQFPGPAAASKRPGAATDSQVLGLDCTSTVGFCSLNGCVKYCIDRIIQATNRIG